MEFAVHEDKLNDSKSTCRSSALRACRCPILSRLRTDPSVNGFPKSWQRYLCEPLDYPIYLIRARDIYPLAHQQRAFDKWVINHPFEGPPGLGYNLLAMEGNVEDTCHPPHPLSLLIAAAIRGFPTGKLTSKEIRLALMRRYSFFSTLGSQWHDDVTSTLNTNPHMFQGHAQSRPSTKIGDMETLWEMNPEYDPLNDNTLQPVTKIPKAMQIDRRLQLGTAARPHGRRTNKSSNEPDANLENLMKRLSLRTRTRKVRSLLEDEMKNYA